MEATTHHLEDKAEKLKTMDEELEEEIEKLKMECRKRILKEQYKNDYKKVKQELRYIIPITFKYLYRKQMQQEKNEEQEIKDAAR